MKSIINDQAADISAKSPQPKSPEPKSPKQKHRGGNTKRTGELSEAAFLLKAESLGFRVAKPWGDSERYDFILDNGHRLWRVQVKCTAYLRLGGYDVQPVHTDQTHKAAYTSEDIDFLVAHIIPLNLWYVVPVAVLGPGISLRFYPDGNCKRARFEQYREAWSLLRTGRDGDVNEPATDTDSNLLNEAAHGNPENGSPDPPCSSEPALSAVEGPSVVKEVSDSDEEAAAEEEDEPAVSPQPPLPRWNPIWRPIWKPKIFER